MKLYLNVETHNFGIFLRVQLAQVTSSSLRRHGRCELFAATPGRAGGDGDGVSHVFRPGFGADTALQARAHADGPATNPQLHWSSKVPHPRSAVEDSDGGHMPPVG